MAKIREDTENVLVGISVLSSIVLGLAAFGLFEDIGIDPNAAAEGIWVGGVGLAVLAESGIRAKKLRFKEFSFSETLTLLIGSSMLLTGLYLGFGFEIQLNFLPTIGAIYIIIAALMAWEAVK